VKKSAWLVSVVLAGGVLVALRTSGGCLTKKGDPDQELAGRFAALCEIAGDHIDSPVPGIRKIGRYLGRHTDDMLGELGGTIQLIESIPDDAKHDARARLARTRIHKPIHECEDTWKRFGEAVEADPEASEILNRALDRLGRTLEIIFGENKTIDFKHLPIDLIKRFE
jgi:hypothetical protein